MINNPQRIDWDAPNVFQNVLARIQDPLHTIIEASQSKDIQKPNVANAIILSNSQEIANIVEGFLEEIASKAITVYDKQQPQIYTIFARNANVRAMCQCELDTDTLCQTDRNWLLDFEAEVFRQIKSSQFNLYDLAYTLAVSERQLHRKIKKLVSLTPNKYIRILKLSRAMEYIDQFVYNTVSELAYAVGYYDTHYFSRIFRQQYNHTPKTLLALKANEF